MFGISPREFLATNEAFLDVVHPEDRTAIDAAYKESLHQNLDSYDNEHRIILKKTGEIRYVHERCENIRDSSGRFIRSVGMVQDITERRQAEEKLVKLNECFLKFGPDTLVNINLLVALSGELMGGTCALYNCLQGGMLCSLGQWNTPPGYQSVDHPEGHLCNDVIKSTGETTVIIRDLQNTSYALTDPNVRLYRLKTYIGKAVKFNNINIGSLCVVFQRDIIPGNNEIRLMEIIASAIGVEEARKQAEEEIRKSKKLLEDLHKHLTEILENERALIAREIHDQIGQSLTALKLDINRMKEFVGSNPEAVAMLRGMIELVTNTIKDVQRISSELRPGILDDLGLVSAIEWYCGEFKERTGIKCSLKLDDSFTDDSQKSLIFFRVFQETLTNVIRHARASSVNIKLHQSDKGTTLTIQDNGIGIPEEKIESQKSLGLINMRERVKQFNGKIDFSSKKGEGTKLTIFIPS
jgi:PAS domain S-box-containing protein